MLRHHRKCTLSCHPGKGAAFIRDLTINALMLINQTVMEIPAQGQDDNKISRDEKILVFMPYSLFRHPGKCVALIRDLTIDALMPINQTTTEIQAEDQDNPTREASYLTLSPITFSR